MRFDLCASPSKESLDTSLGFDVPSIFVDIVSAIWREAKKVEMDANTLFASLFENPGGPDCRHSNTPPELFPIASMGVDGVHYGYVIHAPETGAIDFPLGEICPMEDQGVFLLGKDTLDAFENQMSQSLWRAEQWEYYSLDEQTSGAMNAVATQFGLSPASAKRNRRYGPDGNGQPISPAIPPGWHFVLTSDGVGVLAEGSRFRSEVVLNLATLTKSVSATLDAAKTDLADGYAASALVLLREGYWRHWSDDSAFASFNEMLIRAYDSLNRPLLARVVEDRVRKHLEIQRRRGKPRPPFMGGLGKPS